MIEFCGVTLRYPYDEFAVLKNISFTLQKGVNTVICDSQSGKTSLCKLLCNQVAAESGNILLNGEEISRITNQDRGILYLSKTPAFFERRSVEFNVGYPLRLRRIPKSEIHQRVIQTAEKVGIAHLLQSKASKLNADNRIRLALARGLTVERKVILWDGLFDGDGITLSIDEGLALFNAPTQVIFTERTDVLLGNVVVLDGGECVYCGDAEGAKEVVKSLKYWLAKKL